MTFNGKKLLILGANPETVPLIEKANNMGVHTVVVDHVPGSFAKKFATESYDIDGFDVDALVELSLRIGIDGVLVGVADRLIVPYQELCEKLNLPCYGTKEQCAILTDKVRFNEKCKVFGIDVIPTYVLTADIRSEDLCKLQYPVLIKPSDSNSGKGMSICTDENQVRVATQKALQNSKTGQFLVERYMTCDDIYIFYTFVDGVCWPSIIADRFTHKGQDSGSPVCLGAVSPSKHANLYFDSIHEKMCSMFRSIGMESGVLMISAFVEGNQFYFYDPGFRLQGEAPNLTVKKMTGFDQLEMLISFALSGEVPSGCIQKIKDCRVWGQYSTTIWYLMKQDEIETIQGWNQIEEDPDVFKAVCRLKRHDVITPAMIGTEGQVLARVYASSPSKAMLVEKIKLLQSVLTVIGVSGEDMLIAGFDADKIFH